VSQESIQKVILSAASDLEVNRRFDINEAQLNHLRSEIRYLFNRAILGLIISTIILFVMAA